MPTYKVTYFFNLAQQGWTENYFVNADTAQEAAQINGSPTDVVNWRAVGTQLFAVRASDVDLPRRAFTQFLGYTSPAVLGSSGNVLNTPDPATTCVLWRITSLPSTIRRFVWIRGLADRDVNRTSTGQPSPSGALNAALTNYIAFLKANSYEIRYLHDTTPPFQWYPVLNMAPNLVNNNWTDFQVATPITGIAPGDRVYFRNVDRRLFPFLKGSYPAYVSATSPTTYTIHFKMIQANAVAPANMQVRRQDYLTVPITNSQIEDFREHLTGRPTERYRGRRSADRVSH